MRLVEIMVTPPGARAAAISIRAFSPEYCRAAHLPSGILTCIIQQFRITQGVGHGDEYGAEARQESAAAKTGGGAEATGRAIGGKPARPCAPGCACAHST